jgi:CRP/FNR family cyclic AMP-dependent transcriptional regulator
MPVTIAPDRLGEIALFRGLSLAQLTKLNELLHRKVFSTGTTFISAEQPGEVFYVIVSGAVKVFIEDVEGAEVILAILTTGEVIGEMSLVDASARCANAVAMEETTVLWMDRASFRECLRTMPAIHDNMLRLLCNRLRLANERIQSLALQDVEGRVARQLLAFADIYGKSMTNGDVRIPFRLTQSDLASLIGATRVRVNQVIAAYKQRGYLSVDPRYRITIHNQAALARRARRPIQPLNGKTGAEDRKAKTQLFEAGVPNFTGAV